MYCSNCGKELCDNAVICPGCGAATGKPLGAKQESNVLAIVGFVLAFLMPVAGLVCSILGKNRAAELGGSGKGRIRSRAHHAEPESRAGQYRKPESPA